MELIRATEREAAELIAFYQHVADRMEDSGLRQWHWGRYPNEEMIREDIEKGNLYYLRVENRLAAAVMAMVGQDPEYEKLNWSCGIRPGLFHRLAVNPAMQGNGLGGVVLDDVMQILRRRGCDCIRCDTSVMNSHAISLYKKLGFRRCGTLRWADSANDFITFDKPLKRETPLWPIPMKPAFRDETLTPWGGTWLREKYGKPAKGTHTGECLEVSCIPGLESTDAQGRKLPDLIREYGEKLVGGYVDKPFPLLLKLLDVRNRLSVQVHPDDEYAVARENGKAGKDEAWLVLDTPADGGEVVYGLRTGTTLHALREAGETGSGMEKLLNRVKVWPGDVCYIPAGCIHAVGDGMMLYEIQQTSDLSYRLYDWNRTDENGCGRPLDLDKALDVADLKLSLSPVRVGKAFGIKRVLTEPYFTLDLIRTDGMVKIPAPHDFGILTVTEGDTELRFAGGAIRMKAGDTCLLPKDAPEMALIGDGSAVLAMPKKADPPKIDLEGYFVAASQQ